jgi:hypothetical protein
MIWFISNLNRTGPPAVVGSLFANGRFASILLKTWSGFKWSRSSLKQASRCVKELDQENIYRSASRNLAALNSRTRLGERRRSRLLHEIVEDSGGSDGDNPDDKTCGDEHTHRVSPFSRDYPSIKTFGTLLVSL